MYEILSESIYPVLSRQPEHYAQIKGSSEYPDVKGMVFFYRFRKGTLVVADISGLPDTESAIFGFHIHEGQVCVEDEGEPFAAAPGHFNPYGQEHPLHAGDMPVLFSNDGIAWGAFFTERFLPMDVKGRTVVIHDMPDDYNSQPAGNSGRKIACGVIS